MKREWIFNCKYTAIRKLWMNNELGLAGSRGEFRFLDLNNGECIFKLQSKSKRVIEVIQLAKEMILAYEKSINDLYCFNPYDINSDVAEVTAAFNTVEKILSVPGSKGSLIYGCSLDNRHRLIRLNQNCEILWESYSGKYERREKRLIWGDQLAWLICSSNFQAHDSENGKMKYDWCLATDQRVGPVKFALDKMWVIFKNQEVYIVDPSSGVIEKKLSFDDMLVRHIIKFSSSAVLLKGLHHIRPYRVADGFIPFQIDFLKLQNETGRDCSLHGAPMYIGDRIYVGSHDCHLWCFDAHTGDVVDKWKFNDFVHSVFLAPNGFLIVEVMDGTWHAFSDYPR